MLLDTYEEGTLRFKVLTGKRGRPPIVTAGIYTRIGKVVTFTMKKQKPDDEELTAMFPDCKVLITRLP